MNWTRVRIVAEDFFQDFNRADEVSFGNALFGKAKTGFRESVYRSLAVGLSRWRICNRFTGIFVMSESRFVVLGAKSRAAFFSLVATLCVARHTAFEFAFSRRLCPLAKTGKRLGDGDCRYEERCDRSGKRGSFHRHSVVGCVNGLFWFSDSLKMLFRCTRYYRYCWRGLR